MLSASDPTRRFSNRVEYYILYRPKYPAAVLQLFQAELGLLPTHTIADIGSGTGFSAELFLQNGNTVFGVEPNREMREAAESLLKDYPNFKSIEGTAEATTLGAHSIDFIIVGQAFHWFNPVQAKVEFKRILKLGGTVALIWNQRLTDTTPFARAYEELLLNYGTDYQDVSHKTVTATDVSVLQEFFAPQGFTVKSFANAQVFDFLSLKGRLLSSSYAPLQGHPNFEPTLAELQRIFDEFQADGHVQFDYQTMVYYGQLV
ncbi:MAG: class I SAM-dependent methyltransferase [Abitibacteriaceae bacterium]|nr:class I SAM-dependent methyltransferase [Abditibacteriaceae bacterium]